MSELHTWFGPVAVKLIGPGDSVAGVSSALGKTMIPRPSKCLCRPMTAQSGTVESFGILVDYKRSESLAPRLA